MGRPSVTKTPCVQTHRDHTSVPAILDTRDPERYAQVNKHTLNYVLSSVHVGRFSASLKRLCL